MTRATTAGAALLGVLVTATVLGPFLTPDPGAIDLMARLAPPSLAHPLGTDEIGATPWPGCWPAGGSRCVAAATALLAAVIGTAFGLAAGYFGGRVDALLMRVTDGVMALPLLPLLIVLAAIDPAKLGLPAEVLGSETFAIGRIVVIIALVGWTTVARLVRA